MRSWKKDIRRFRAVALMSVPANLYAAVVVGLLHEDPEIELKELHVGAERGICTKHTQELFDEYSAETLGVARRSTRCLGS